MNTLVSLVIALRDVEPEKCQVWVQVRQENGRLNGKWEFPGGKLEAGETPVITAQREFIEEVGPKIELNKFMAFRAYPFEYSDRKVTLYSHLLYFSPSSGLYNALPENGWKELVYADPLKGWGSEIPEANINLLKDLATYCAEINNESELGFELWQRLSC